MKLVYPIDVNACFENKEFFVTWQVEGFDKNMEAGPYKNLDLTLSHFRDISGYEGIINVKVEARVKTGT